MTQAQQLDRRRFIGSSDVASVLNVDPRRTAVGLWHEKTGRSEPEVDAELEKFFRRRRRQEPVIAEMLQEDYGVRVTRLSYGDPNRYVDPEHDFLAAEIDFEFLMSPEARAAFPQFAHIPDGETVNGEIKTANYFVRSKFGEEGTDEVVVEYVAQAQHGMMVARRRACLLAALFGLDRLVCYPIVRDDEVVADLRSRAISFWRDHVLADVPPEPVNIDDVGMLYSRVNGRRCELSDEAKEALEQLLDLRVMMNDGEKKKDELAFIIANHVRKAWGKGAEIPEQDVDDAVLLWQGRPVATWKKQRGTSLDQKRLKAEKPEITEAFTREHWFRVMRRPAKGTA